MPEGLQRQGGAPKYANGFARSGKVINLYKRLGETPRERLERLRHDRREFEHEVLSYAGRLDPMAEGVLLALAGGANARREEYLNLPKEYTLDILFGFSTDTYDVLGKVMDKGATETIRRKELQQSLNEFRGEVSQEYPPYSSKTVQGKSLFEWARTNALGTLILPRRTVTVHEIDITAMYKVSEAQLLAYIEEGVGRVNGDFRQDEVVRLWRRQLSSKGKREFPAATVFISCTSGTYARSIANGVGEKLGVPALALHILRTKVGEFDINDSLR
jgi:tRNA pseudouridine55 synthase